MTVGFHQTQLATILSSILNNILTLSSYSSSRKEKLLQFFSFIYDAFEISLLKMHL